MRCGLVVCSFLRVGVAALTLATLAAVGGGEAVADDAPGPSRKHRIEVPVGAPVSGKTHTRDAPAVSFDFNPNLPEFRLDRSEIEQRIRRRLEEELGDAAAVVAVEVDYAEFLYRGPCLVDLRVTANGNEPFGLQSAGRHDNFERACELVIDAAVEDIVKDARVGGGVGR